MESEAEVESPAAWLVEFGDGRIRRLRAYRDADEALSERPAGS
jgi:hypothetical protein